MHTAPTALRPQFEAYDFQSAIATHLDNFGCSKSLLASTRTLFLLLTIFRPSARLMGLDA